MTSKSKRTYGDITKARVKLLVAALLICAKGNLVSHLPARLQGQVEVKVKSPVLLTFRASRVALIQMAKLCNQKHDFCIYDKVIQSLDVTDVLFHLQYTLSILSDHRPSNSNLFPHFTLELWFPYHQVAENLAQIDQIWAKAREDKELRNIKDGGQGRTLIKSDSNCDSESKKFNHPDITFKNKNCKIVAYRLIPFYLGCVNLKKENWIEEIKVNTFRDGFAVAQVNETKDYENIVDFLVHRRLTHQSILAKESFVTNALRQAQELVLLNPLIFSSPDSLAYVMSLHHIPNATQVSLENYKLMAEPSILGITDDPNDELERISSQENFLNNLSSLDVLEKNIQTINTTSACFYISWANVIVGTNNIESSEVDILLNIEIALQKLWYKLFLYTQNLGCIENYFNSIDLLKLKKMKTEIIKTKIEYMNFLQPNAMGASHLNLLKEKLITTSRIEEVYKSFVNNSNILFELESVL